LEGLVEYTGARRTSEGRVELGISERRVVLEVPFRAGHEYIIKQEGLNNEFSVPGFWIEDSTTGERAASGVKPHLDEAREAVLAKKESIVLFKITANEEGDFESFKYVDLFIHSPYKYKNIWRYRRWSDRITAPSLKSKKEGWRFVLLAPGSYRFGLTSKKKAKVRWETAEGHNLVPSFVFKVPRGKPIVYAGSIQSPCEKEILLVWVRSRLP
jgi:hypothetical protein